MIAAALFAVDPVGTGGVLLRASPGPRRDAWLARLRELLAPGTPLRRLPSNVSDERLLGGLDLAATLRAGRPVAQTGLLSEADGGVVVVAMAERLRPSVAAQLAAVLDTREVVLERDGLGTRRAARLGVVALDEGDDADEAAPARLGDRLAFHVLLDERTVADVDTADVDTADADADVTTSAETLPSPADVAAARAVLADVVVDAAIIEALCQAALALGVESLRAPWLATRVARAAAALRGADRVSADDAALAARLVLGPRATRMPATADDAAQAAADDAAPADAGDTPQPDALPPDAPEDPAARDEPPLPHPGSGPDADADDNGDDHDADVGTVDDVVLQAALAAIPSGLLEALKAGVAPAKRQGAGGRAGNIQLGAQRGRPNGVRRGALQSGARLNLIETLRAAAPWQALRRREAPAASANRLQVHVRRDDFRVTRFRQRSETTTVFVVDASGSAALHRLAEAKGAVELLLADCYVRRDSVALLSMRGRGAELLLPPTRSLVRAKRCLDGLPGGGGTPLASGIDAALLLASGLRRKGVTPLVVLLTDGRANIARDGTPGRARAGADATAAAVALRCAGVQALLLDTSPQPQPTAQQLAEAMGARYLPLPYADAQRMSHAVRAAMAARAPERAGA